MAPSCQQVLSKSPKSRRGSELTYWVQVERRHASSAVDNWLCHVKSAVLVKESIKRRAPWATVEPENQRVLCRRLFRLGQHVVKVFASTNVEVACRGGKRKEEKEEEKEESIV